ncbi:hypothetical protein [Paludisphaera mucosa]|uniref:Uncharacterized protein n=1 Tax=Paludisphaera mucosa TaxID=3030827 RepID=A0ABT6F531_9BACT|nr:hypothetical protein [Paludisphaera mucosa]MDG3002606.1 hypothetical protein [Paludisphaera mucosa]
MFARPRHPTVRRPRTSRRPAFEPLEGRQLMTLGPEMIYPINTTNHTARFSDNATSSGGSSVVVWSQSNNEPGFSIRAQRFNSFGTKLGPEFIVGSSNQSMYSPAVAMDDLGGFVVTWTQQLANGDSDALAQRFDSNGNHAGGLIEVGVGRAREGYSDVATDRLGNFVISYNRQLAKISTDVVAKRYDRGGQLLGVLDVAVGTVADAQASIAMNPDGRFDIAWERGSSGTQHDILLKRFTAGGGLLGTHFISTNAADDRDASVSMDNAGNAVVAWCRAGDIKARRVGLDGALGAEVGIAGTTAFEYKPAVALRRGGGGFVVAYEVQARSGGNRTRVAEVSFTNTVSTVDIGVRSDPALSIDWFGNYLLTYTSYVSIAAGDIWGRRGSLSA